MKESLSVYDYNLYSIAYAREAAFIFRAVVTAWVRVECRKVPHEAQQKLLKSSCSSPLQKSKCLACKFSDRQDAVSYNLFPACLRAHSIVQEFHSLPRSCICRCKKTIATCRVYQTLDFSSQGRAIASNVVSTHVPEWRYYPKRCIECRTGGPLGSA